MEMMEMVQYSKFTPTSFNSRYTYNFFVTPEFSALN